MKKEIKSRIMSIVSVLLFLIVSTWFFYGPRKYLVYASMNLNKYYTSNELEIVNDGELEINKTNDFIIKNKSNQEIHYQVVINNDYARVRSKNCKMLSNNYLSYHIKLDEQYDIERVLSVDGIIYRGTLKPNEKKEFELEMKSKSDIDTNQYCFYPTLHASKESI